MPSLSENRQALFCNDSKSIADYKKNMNTAVQAVSDWLQNDKMYTGGSIRQLREKIAFNPNKDGLGLENALNRAVEIFLNNSLKVHHPHSLAHLHCPTMVASQIAEVLINATNQSMDSWDQSPAGSLMEVQMIDWLRQKAGFGVGTAGVFTSGGTQSNLMGVLLARDWCIAKHFKNDKGEPWSVQRLGIPADAMQKVKVLCSQNAHFSVQKNMAMMGMGFQSVVAIPVNDHAQMDTAELERIMSELTDKGNIIACVVATAGTTDAGAIDDIKEVRKITNAHGAWLHIDAAWGGALLLSNQYRDKLAGIEEADSITLDFHKHYFQSISCGAFLLKDEQNYRFMHYEAEYLNSAYDEEHGVPNLVSKSLQTTRRFDALKLWLTIEALGETLYGEMIDHGVDLTCEVADYIKASDELELLVEPQFASVLFRVVPKGYPDELIDSLNQNVADELFAKGEANIGVTRVIDNNRDVQSLKMTTLSPIATLDNVKALLAQVLEQANAIKDDIQNGVYTPPID
ncbi:aspartate aminotransferase family protein [Moraxella nasovis]|uniref:pyridoxal phosphate-dependent decarboxylase family protein n=1 Tax=Moraxella nasovis TaxID=2904121 RepID=UPI001F6062FA|nr:aspartate aminotransferase family protein [Moraxella nasovis]UNU73805.1 aspartate aminotransferase family protein [Moraxella nasovis]